MNEETTQSCINPEWVKMAHKHADMRYATVDLRAIASSSFLEGCAYVGAQNRGTDESLAEKQLDSLKVVDNDENEAGNIALAHNEG